ncbi:2Fe-2S iron-sulfur cluster-binding protein [Kineosporia sp. A_224]|uniref:2Fe-2S iron-sulfur cluster-binding protein n=1 Tax=Kineosporia sp. A_224 TaxID=1962180 RepID=UPI000B4B36A5|nr:2Fe-2S iron-sulfur cluster-binding protein [Kineosporia sp. A_224]
MTASVPATGTAAAARPHRVTLAGTDRSFDVAPGERLLGAARRAGVWLPYECGWGGCGTCKVQVVEGTTQLLFEAAPAVDPRDARRGRVVACQSAPTSDLVVKAPRADDVPTPERPTRDHRARLETREELAPDIVRLRLRLDREAVYRPGQHAVLGLGPGLRRCYSMAGPPGSTEVSFVVKRYPGRPGSERAFALAPGEEVDVELPYGDMWLRDGDRPAVLVAGGTGISAISALAQHLAGQAGTPAAERVSRPVHVFYGAATRAELVCWDELVEHTAAMPDGHLHGALVTPDAGWGGAVGFVTEPLADRLPALGDADFYVAGPPVMTDAVTALLRTHGVQLDRVHHDSFG